MAKIASKAIEVKMAVSLELRVWVVAMLHLPI
jgi:hypothetical protein